MFKQQKFIRLSSQFMQYLGRVYLEKPKRKPLVLEHSIIHNCEEVENGHLLAKLEAFVKYLSWVFVVKRRSSFQHGDCNKKRNLPGKHKS